MYVKTSNTRRYPPVWRSLNGYKHVVVSVKACSNAHIQLWQAMWSAERRGFEVQLEVDQARIVNMATNATVTQVQQQGLLSCNGFRTFWLDFHDGVLTVGRGAEQGQQEILRHEGQPEDISALNAMSVGGVSGEEAEWEFVEGRGKIHTLSLIPVLPSVSFGDFQRLENKHF